MEYVLSQLKIKDISVQYHPPTHTGLKERFVITVVHNGEWGSESYGQGSSLKKAQKDLFQNLEEGLRKGWL